MNDEWEQWPPIEGNDTGGFLFVIVMVAIVALIFVCVF
jgi:hypothetical protein